MSEVRLLFVCLGNICRSPTAHGVMESMLAEAALPFDVQVDSAGTGAWHIGHPPDERSQEAARLRGVELGGQRARRVEASDFHRFQYILAMDEDNLADLQKLRPADASAELALLLSYAEAVTFTAVPDPYYGGTNGFEQVLDLVEQGCAGLLDELRRRYT
jgi:low molecular weight protein-tyrosine phosphatase